MNGEQIRARAQRKSPKRRRRAGIERLPLSRRIELLIRNEDLPEPKTEIKFHPHRNWRIDYGYKSLKLGWEIHGGKWINGRHQRAQGFENDREKMNEAALHGWIVLEFTEGLIRSGKAVEQILRAIDLRCKQESEIENLIIEAAEITE